MASFAQAQDLPAKPRFGIYEIRLLGNTVLDTVTIERTLYPFLGPNRTLDDVESARQALERVYHDGGFGTVFVDIPEQAVGDDGVVRLTATEGRLGRSRVEGERFSSARQIRQELPDAQPGTVPNLPKLQAEIQAANAMLADRTIVPVLKAGANPGTVDLTLRVQDKLPLHGSVELNNQYTADTKPLRLTAVLSYDNLFRRFDSIGLQYQVAPQARSQVGVLAASYSARLPYASDRLSFTLVNSSSSVATVGAFGVTGKGNIYGLRYAHPLISSTSEVAQVVLGADYKEFSQDVIVSQTSSVATPIHYTVLSASYGLTLRHPQQLLSWSTTAEFGLNGLGASVAEFANKCYQCRPNFALVRMDGSLVQQLPRGFSAQIQLSGQYAPDPVISNEQFYIGGAQSVRGYYEAEDLGDVGLRGALVLSAPSLIPGTRRVHVSPYLFYDEGRIKYQAPLPEQPTTSTLRSFGAGLDLSWLDYLTGSLTWADPLLDGSRTQRGDTRWEFFVRSAW
jgi:hemolysin activation/secretion protein